MIKQISYPTILLIFFFLSSLSGQNKSWKYKITEADQKYLEKIRVQNCNSDSLNSEFHSYNIIAYQDNNAGSIKLFSDKCLKIELKVLPLPYIGRFLKRIYSIKEFAHYYNVWEDSLHIHEDKRGIYFYKILPNNSFKLIKYYGDKRKRKRRENRIFPGKDIISLLNNRLKGELFNEVETFFFGYAYFGNILDSGDSISLDPNKFFVVETKGTIPIIDDKAILVKELYAKFDEAGDFIEGGGLIKKGFNTSVRIKENQK